MPNRQAQLSGEHDDPITVLSALGKRLEETAVPAETLPALVETIAQTLKLPCATLPSPNMAVQCRQ